MTVEHIRSLGPCAGKWREFKRAVGDKKTVTLLEIAEASGPHGLLWVLYTTRLPFLPKQWKWKPLKDWYATSCLSSSHAARRKPKWSHATPARWMQEHDEGMRIVYRVLGVKAKERA